MRSWLAASITLILAIPALAQGPAGNTHPDGQLIAGDDHVAPFGDPVYPSSTSLEARRELTREKVDFAKRVDLEPLRGLAVFHSGRVKILDTLARDTVSTITGRKNYVDFIHGDREGDVDDYKHDPLFTLLDIVIDPAYYLDKPLVHVNYLPLRRRFVEAAFPQDQMAQERWMKLTRLSPIMIDDHGAQLEQSYIFEPGYNGAFQQISRARALWQQSGANMLLVAPSAPDDPWLHITDLPQDHPARLAAMQLGQAWRAMDPEGVAGAAETLAESLRAVNPEIYPTQRASLELLYNKSNAFNYGALLYCLSLVSLLLAFGTQRKWLATLGGVLLALGFATHFFGFALRCVIAERYAIQNQFESITGVSLFAVIVAGAIMLWRRQWLFGAAGAATGFLALITATQSGVPGVEIGREAAILNTSDLLKYHVTTVLVSYGLITLGFVVSIFYLATYYLGAKEPKPVAEGASGGAGRDIPVAAVALNLDGSANTGRQRTLADLDTAQMTILQLAFWTLGVGILLGAWWADHSWGRWWAFDPKETWALVTWIVYLIVIHLRFTITGHKRALTTAWLSVVGFFIMLWTYFGVNLLLPGLHAYA